MNDKNIQKVIDANTEDELWSLWVNALRDSSNVSLRDTLLKENMEYLQLSEKETLSCWGEKGTVKIKEKWLINNPKSSNDIKQFYNELDLYIPELSSWHAMEKNIMLMQIIKFMKRCVNENCFEFLDYGCGIGSNGILFGSYGFETTLTDISDVMLNYSKWRLKRKKINSNFIDLKVEKLSKNKFSSVTIIEVLEHTTDPLQVMSDIRESMKTNGLAMISTPFFLDEERPQHLIHDMGTADKITELGFQIESISDDRCIRILRKI